MRRAASSKKKNKKIKKKETKKAFSSRCAGLVFVIPKVFVCEREREKEMTSRSGGPSWRSSKEKKRKNVA